MICILCLAGCNSKASKEEVSLTLTSSESANTGLEEVETIGDVDVDKGLFDVTITLPKDFVGEITQDALNASVKEKGYQSATLNDDGSVTFVMTKAQHKEVMQETKNQINNSLKEMVGSETYPNITSITANDNFSHFEIVTKNTSPDMAESFAALNLYIYGGMYATFNGEPVGNIHVDYINADSGEVISSADSDNMKND